MTYTENTLPAKNYISINNNKMAYIDFGKGDPIVFLHGNPTSSYLWRNILPHCDGLGRLIAVDLIGMGDSEKIRNSNSDNYTFSEHKNYLFKFFEEIGVTENVIFVLHDWGSALGFDWAFENKKSVNALIYMEAIVQELTWKDWPENAVNIFQGLRSPAGEKMILDKNLFVEAIMPNSIIRKLNNDEMTEYRRPFIEEGEDRRPTLTWPRQIPIEGKPEDVSLVVKNYSEWLKKSKIPKLFINAEPGSILVGKQREYCRTWANQDELTVNGLHFIQEDSPNEIGKGISNFIRKIKNIKN